MSSSESMNKTALVMGATGATGKALLRELLISSSYAKIVAVGRRQAKLDSSIPQDKLEQKMIDFENLEAHRDAFRGVNDVYCCLGTTRADAGSAEAFKRIDQGYVVNSAKIIAQENPGSTGLSPVHFLYVSATNANKNSTFLYPKTKGETEEQLSHAGFQRVSIMRPGALELEEPRERPRLLEKIFVDYLMVPANRMFNLHIAVSVGRVAKAMQKVAENAEPVTNPTETKVDFYDNKDIEDLTA